MPLLVSTVKFTLIDQEKDVKVTKEMLDKGGVQGGNLRRERA
jgi:hypothetical protein